MQDSHFRTVILRIGALGVGSAWLLAVAGPRLRGLLFVSASVSLPVAVLATAVGVGLAMLLAKTDVPGRRVAVVLLAGLVLLPLHGITAGWVAALGFRGWLTPWLFGTGPETIWLDGWLGAVVIHTVAAIPWATLLVAAALRAGSAEQEEQALLDASAWQVVRRISLAGAWPAILATALLVAVGCASEIAVTDLFRVRTFAEEVYTQAALGTSLSGITSWLGGVGLLALLLGWSIHFFLTRYQQTFETTVSRPWIVRLGRGRGVATALLVMGMLLLVALPVGALISKAGVVVHGIDGDWHRSWSAMALVEAVAKAPWQHRRELYVSSLLGVAVALSSVLIGWAIAWQLRTRTWTRALWLGLIAVGLATPGPLIAVVAIRVLNQPLDSPLAWLGGLYGTWFGPWLVQMVRITPVVALGLWPAVMRVPREQLDAARSDGAGPIARARWVVFPEQWPLLLAVGCVAFALSFGELSATSLVVPPGTPPLSVRLLSLLHYGVEDRVAAICLVLFAAHTLVAGVVIGLLPRWRCPRRSQSG